MADWLKNSVDGRTQKAMVPKEGKEEMDSMWTDIMSIIPSVARIDMAGLVGSLSAVCKNTWLYGYDSALQNTQVVPNGLAMLKLLSEGQVRWFFINTSTLIAAMRKIMSKEEVTPELCINFIESIGDEGMVQQLSDAGCSLFTALQHKDEVLFVPAGWHVCERVIEVESASLVYGVRKTFLVKGDCTAYEELIGSRIAAKLPVDKWEQALAVLQQPSSF